MSNVSVQRGWEDRIALGAVAAGALALWCFGGSLSLAAQVLLWAGLLATLALLLRQGWLKLFGPVLFYDLVRMGRRSRYITIRFVYAAILLGVLVWMDYLWTEEHRAAVQVNPIVQTARMAEYYFSTFMTVQVVAVLLLTPAYTAGAISEEKDRKTLEFILATDLEDREIVLSKLLSRLLSLAYILLVSVPILSLMQFLGGVDPEMVLACYLATGLTMTSLASLSILASVYARKTRDALGRVYVAMIAYLALVPILELILSRLIPSVGALYLVPVIGGTPLWFNDDPPTLLSAVEAFDDGNIFMAYWRLAFRVGTGSRLSAVLGEVLEHYLFFQLAVTGISATWAVLRLRAVALGQANRPALKPKATGPAWAPRRPAVGNRPMLWKEVHVESAVRLNLPGRILVALVVGLSFVPAACIMYAYFIYDWLYATRQPPNWDDFYQAINIWVRVAGTIVACVLLLTVAVRASGTVTGERDRQTWDSLLTSPLSAEAMFFAKWWGSLASVRWGLLWLCGIWVAGCLLGGVQWWALPFLFLAWCVLAAFFASLGMWFTTSSATSMRATLMTMMVGLLCGGLNWIVLGMCCYTPMMWSTRNEPAEEIMRFHGMGLTPPVTLGWLALHGNEFDGWNRSNAEKNTACAILGLPIWAFAAFALYGMGSLKFREVSGRARTHDYLHPLAEPRPVDSRSWG